MRRRDDRSFVRFFFICRRIKIADRHRDQHGSEGELAGKNSRGASLEKFEYECVTARLQSLLYGSRFKTRGDRMCCPTT